jgi:hypothetical protein
MNQSQDLAQPSLIERVFAALQDNRGDLLRPQALVIAHSSALEHCDQVQRALGAQSDDAFVLSNFVDVDESNGSIVRWQFLTVRPSSTCADGDCKSVAFPLCSSFGACGRLFEGSRVGLRAALAHILAQVPEERRDSLSAALVQLERDPLEKVPFRCIEVYASTRKALRDLRNEKIKAEGQVGLQNELVANQTTAQNKQTVKSSKTCTSCNASDAVLRETKSALLCAAQRRQRYQRMALMGFALLFLVVAIVAIVFAIRKGKSKTAHEQAARKLDELYDIARRESQST